MRQFRQILRFLAIAGAVLPASAAQHYDITPALVAGTMSRMGIQISPQQVTLLTNVVATQPAPILKVSSVSKMDQQQLLARMECANGGECLPFFVSIRLQQGGDAQASLAAMNQASLATGPSLQPAGLKRGASARLLLEGPHVQIIIPVICLEAGSPGQTIRVAARDHKVVYSAQVVNGALLKGNLP